MFQNNHSLFRKNTALLLSLVTAGMLVACGQNTENAEDLLKQESVLFEDIPEEYRQENRNNIDTTPSSADNAPENSISASTADTAKESNSANTGASQIDAAKVEELKKLFGDNCITKQTFEVELSEYDGTVYFVALAPSAENPDFSMQIVRNGEILTNIRTYTPEKLADTAFTSLDAVSFYDVNYDSYTDIVTIVTHGDNTFAAVYYGFDENQAEYGNYFVSQEWLSDHITESLPVITIPEIRNLLAGGKKNGSFTDYREAYKNVSTLYELAHNGDVSYNLIYVDNDDIPELVAGVRGYYASLYTFHDGTVYSLMDDWGYGAMGNAGYEYAPKENNLRNYNTDHAGAILYTTYMAINEEHCLETTAQIKTVNFDDVNENGMLDESEFGSLGMYGITYLDGKEISYNEIPSFDAENYEYIEPTIRLEELEKRLDS